MKFSRSALNRIFAVAMVMISLSALSVPAFGATPIPLKSGTTTSPAIKTPNSALQTNPLPNVKILQPGAVDGQIANVRASAGQAMWTGTMVRVEWDWPGYVNNPADVTIWKETQPGASVQVDTIITQRRELWAGWVIPYNFAPGPYTIKVTSSSNPNNRAELRILIKDSTITVTSPNSNFTMANGSTYSIWWQYQGKPGPVKIELNTTMGGTPMLIANNVPPGNLGLGKYDWQVFENLAPASNYLVKVTSLASTTITGTSQPFTIARPSITILKPQPGDIFLPGVYVPILWKSVGNLGSTVAITAWPSGGSGTSLDIQSPIGAGGQGGYDRWMPTPLSASQKFLIRVESVQNRAFAGVLSSPITVMAQQGPPAGQVLGASGPSQAAGVSGFATLSRAEVIFYTVDDNKDHDTSVNVYVSTSAGKRAAWTEGAASSANGSTEFRNASTMKLDLSVDKSIRKSDCTALVLKVGEKPVGNDHWQFRVTVILYFTDSTTVWKTSRWIVDLWGANSFYTETTVEGATNVGP